jgi:hypothetical protein
MTDPRAIFESKHRFGDHTVTLAHLGQLMALIGTLWMLFVAFEEGFFWGFGCLLLPFMIIYFTFAFWSEAKKPFLVWLAGWILVAIGYHMDHPATGA